MILTRRTLLATGTMFLAAPYVRASSPVVVDMLNKHPDDPKQRQIFLPRLVVIDPGQSVLFKATDPGHNAASVDGMIPEGAEPWEGKIGKDIEVELTKPGVYGYVCTPHAAAGMVGVVVVQGEGALDNLEAAKAVKQRAKGKRVFAEIWEEIDQLGLSG